MLTAEAEIESLPSVTSDWHTHTHKYSVLCPHSPSPPSSLFMCCPRTRTSSPRLTSHPVWVSTPVFDYWGQPDGARERNGQQEKKRNEELSKGGASSSRVSQEQARGGFRGRKRDSEGQTAARERTGKRSLGKRLGTKTQGNWETKSEPGINREEEKRKDERSKAEEGLGVCEARITQTFVTSSGGSEHMHTPDINAVVVLCYLSQGWLSTKFLMMVQLNWR